MSLLVRPTQTLIAMDPVLRVQQANSRYIIEKGASAYNLRADNAQSYSDQQIMFNMFPPDRSSFVDRQMWIKMQMDVSIVDGDTGNPIKNDFLQGGSALRFLPLSNIISNATLTVGNNSSFSFNINKSITGLARAGIYQQDIYGNLSTCPSMPDTTVEYGGNIGSMNPLNPYLDSQFFAEARGAFEYEVVSETGNTACTLRFKWVEPVFLPALLVGHDECGFVGVDQIQLQLQLANLSRIISHNNVDFRDYTSVSATISAIPQILWRSMTADLSMGEIPRSIQYGYSSPVYYPTQCSALATATDATITTSNIQMNGVPSKMVVFIREQDSSLDYTKADGFARIKSISVQFGNNTGLLSNASEEQLFLMSRKNGLSSISWQQWKNQLGSVLIASFPRDLGIPNPTSAPGVANFSSNLSMTITYHNLASATVTHQACVVLFYDSVMTITDGNVVTQNSAVTPREVVESKDVPVIDAIALDPQANIPGAGGNVFGSIKNVLSKGWDIVNPILKDTKILSKAAKFLPYVGNVASPIVDALGYGKKGKGLVGNGAYIGGKKLTKADLKKLMK